MFHGHTPVLSVPCHLLQPEGCWHCFGSVVLSLCACLPLSRRKGAGLAASLSEGYSQKLKGGKVLRFPMSPWGLLCSRFQDNSVPKSCLFVCFKWFVSLLRDIQDHPCSGYFLDFSNTLSVFVCFLLFHFQRHNFILQRHRWCLLYWSSG